MAKVGDGGVRKSGAFKTITATRPVKNMTSLSYIFYFTLANAVEAHNAHRASTRESSVFVESNRNTNALTVN